MKHFRGTRDGFVVRVGVTWVDNYGWMTPNVSEAHLFDTEKQAQRDAGHWLKSTVVAATLKIHAITEDAPDDGIYHYDASAAEMNGEIVTLWGEEDD